MPKKTTNRKNAKILPATERQKRVKNINRRRTKTGIITRDVRRKSLTKSNKRLGK